MNYYINLAYQEENSTVLGPGKRHIIWVQGCNLGCSGCINPHLQSFREANLVKAVDLAKGVIKETQSEGVTITGGEPFLQPGALACFSQIVKEAGLTIQVYSGFYLEELIASDSPEVFDFLDQIDVLIAGRYLAGKKIRSQYKGSSNQNIYFFTEAYSKEDYNKEQSNCFELNYQNNKIRMVGFYD